MRRKSDMWQTMTPGEFLPGEVEQAAKDSANDVRERLATVEEQLRSQFTSMATYAQIAQQAVELARAEARADLDREKATIVSLVERVREEQTDGGVVDDHAPSTSGVSSATLMRLQALEERLDVITSQFAQCLRSQEDLANSIAAMFEHRRRATDLQTTG